MGKDDLAPVIMEFRIGIDPAKTLLVEGFAPQIAVVMIADDQEQFALQTV